VTNLSFIIHVYKGVRGGAVGWGTVQQLEWSRVRFPMVSLEFFIYLTFRSRYGCGVDLDSNRSEYQEYFLGGEGVTGAYGWQPYHLQVPIVLKSGSLKPLEPSGPLQACNGMALLLHMYKIQTNPPLVVHIHSLFFDKSRLQLTLNDEANNINFSWSLQPR